MKILLDTTKHSFDNIAAWVYETMPKDINENRWRFVDILEDDGSTGLLLQKTRTYIEFEDYEDYITFKMRWT